MSSSPAAILNLTDAFLIIIPAVVTIFLAWRIKNAIGPLRILTTLLALFLALHGTYHFLAFYSTQFDYPLADFLGSVVVQPVTGPF